MGSSDSCTHTMITQSARCQCAHLATSLATAHLGSSPLAAPPLSTQVQHQQPLPLLPPHHTPPAPANHHHQQQQHPLALHLQQPWQLCCSRGLLAALAAGKHPAQG
jgi:hypothetical protein